MASAREYLSVIEENIRNTDIDRINKIINLLKEAFRKKSRIFTFGNGGSATTASHFACDLRYYTLQKDKNQFDVICLNDNIAVITATSNDVSFEEVFSHQLNKQAKKDDIVIVFSASGNSKNLVKALMTARDIGAKTISFTGKDGGSLKKISDYNVNVSDNDVARVQDTHLAYVHAITHSLDKDN